MIREFLKLFILSISMLFIVTSRRRESRYGIKRPTKPGQPVSDKLPKKSANLKASPVQKQVTIKSYDHTEYKANLSPDKADELIKWIESEMD